MNYHTVMESIAEWMAANTNGNLFLAPNGVQSQALSLTTSSGNSQQASSPDNVSSSGKTLSIRCVVESVANVQYWDLPHSSGQIEVDRRANIPIHTVFHQLVDAVLQIFGYPKEVAITARGTILLENWKPIRLEKIALNPQKSVNDILGQISSFVTLRIQILRNTNCANTVLSQVKEKLLQLLILQNREYIMSSGCPLDQITLKSFLRGSDYSTSIPSDEVLRKFDQWVINQSRQALRPIPYPGALAQFPYHLGSPNAIPYDKELINNSFDERIHPALQTVQNQYPTQKTRMRTSFDPELELPKLQKWFSENQHPDRTQIKHYVNELNSLESRRGRKPLDVNNVVYWFKNARAAQKRAENRGTPGLLNTLNGYRSDSHSPCDTALTSKESLGSAQSCDDDYIEDDDNRSEGDERDDSLDVRPSRSPVAPLSLTTHKDKNCSRNSSPTQELKQEPPDKSDLQSSPVSLKPEAKDSPVPDRHETDSEDEDMEDEASDTESVHKIVSDAELKNSSLYSNSSPLSLIPRSVNNSLFPVVPNYNFPMFNMSQYMPSIGMNRNTMQTPQPHTPINRLPYTEDRRGKRNRTFIDPVTEVPRLEEWFHMNTHPPHGLIQKYTDHLNSMSYRQKFPRLETKNVQFWFKNRRAKCKRLKSSVYENLTINNNLSSQEQYNQLAVALSSENYRSQE